jgi:hypothetical protein
MQATALCVVQSGYPTNSSVWQETRCPANQPDRLYMTSNMLHCKAHSTYIPLIYRWAQHDGGSALFAIENKVSSSGCRAAHSCYSEGTSCLNIKSQVRQVMPTPSTSMTTWMLVPAFAGSTPNLLKAKGKVLPSKTDVITILKRDTQIAVAFTRSPLVMYTRTKPPTDRTVPNSTPTNACCIRLRRIARGVL